jgi:hypothetical protein
MVTPTDGNEGRGKNGTGVGEIDKMTILYALGTQRLTGDLTDSWSLV